MNKLVLKTLGSILGKKKYQGFFERLYQLSLKGMNIGAGGSTSTSGEAFALEYIHQQLAGINNPVIFDVGANVGDYSLLLKEIFKEKASIYSFEPSKKTYQKFLVNTTGVSNLKPYNFGFGNEETKITLFSNVDESALASVYQRRLDHFDIQMSNQEEIEIRTIDGFCTQNNIQHIHFLKIDVEGHEIKVLEGARNLIGSHAIDFIQFEFGGCNIDSRTYFQDFFYLLKDSFYIYRIVKDGLYKIKGYSEVYEAFNTTNYLAERINR